MKRRRPEEGTRRRTGARGPSGASGALYSDRTAALESGMPPVDHLVVEVSGEEDLALLEPANEQRVESLLGQKNDDRGLASLLVELIVIRITP
jgi:uncharacterized protein (UPF0218 family)